MLEIDFCQSSAERLSITMSLAAMRGLSKDHFGPLIQRGARASTRFSIWRPVFTHGPRSAQCQKCQKSPWPDPSDTFDTARPRAPCSLHRPRRQTDRAARMATSGPSGHAMAAHGGRRPILARAERSAAGTCDPSGRRSTEQFSDPAGSHPHLSMPFEVNYHASNA